MRHPGGTYRFLVSLVGAGALLFPAVSCHRGGGGGGGGAPVGFLKNLAFSVRQEIPTGGEGPMGLVSGDFTGDGVLDLAVSHTITGTVRILPGKGKGLYDDQAGATLPAPGSPLDLVKGDFNGDGSLDLAVLRVQDEKVSVFLGDGKGGFGAKALELPTGKGPVCLAAADLDGDKKWDLLAADAGSGDLLFWKGDGAGAFAKPLRVKLAPGAEPVALAAADFDKDGAAEAALADATSGEVRIFSFGGNPSSSLLLAGKSFTGLAASDLNDDGWLDLAAVSPGEKKVYAILGSPKGFLANPQGSLLPGEGSAVFAGDLDGDGHPDLAVPITNEGVLALMMGDGTGKFREAGVLPVSGLPWTARIGDFDGDGKGDILVGAGLSRVLSLYRGTGKGVAGGRCYGEDLAQPYFVVSQDLNRDGLSDLVVSDRKKGTVHFFLARKGGGFQAERVFDVGREAGNLVRGDFDGDGLEDIAVALDDGVRVLRRGKGEGIQYTLVPPRKSPPFDAGVGPFEVLAEDLDGDGIPELAAADYGGNALSVLKGARGMSFERIQSIPVPDGPLGLAGGDFDGDGKGDLVLSRFRASMLVFFQGKGDGKVAKAAEIPVAALPNYIRTADFNGDGRTDLVVSNLGGSAVTLLLHEKGFRFSLSKVAAGEQPSALLARDLNGDRIPDVLVATVEKGDFRVLLGDGKGGFSSILRFPGVRGAVSADLGDTDGDGLKDLVLGSIYNRRVTLFRNISR